MSVKKSNLIPGPWSPVPYQVRWLGFEERYVSRVRTP